MEFLGTSFPEDNGNEEVLAVISIETSSFQV